MKTNGLTRITSGKFSNNTQWLTLPMPTLLGPLILIRKSETKVIKLKESDTGLLKHSISLGLLQLREDGLNLHLLEVV